MVEDNDSLDLEGVDSLDEIPLNVQREVINVANPAQNTDRKRGILTKKDRNYLLGKEEVEGQDERNLLYRMRQRVRNSVLDLMLLAWSYPDREMEKVAEDIANEYFEQDDKEIIGPYIPLYSQINWAYSWGKVSPLPTSTAFDASWETSEEFIEYSLRSSISRWYATNSDDDELLKDLDVTITIEESDLDFDELENRVFGGHATHREFSTFIRESDDETVLELLNHAQQSGPIRVDPDSDKEMELSAEQILSYYR